MDQPHAHLFKPLNVGGIEVRNRIALPAVLTNFARDSRVTDRWHNFLVERAKGGCGLLVTEIIAVDPLALAHSAIVAGFDERNDDALAKTACDVKAAGGTLVAQLWHPGRQQLWQPSHSPMGVSDQPDAYSWTVPHVMSTAELKRLGDAYVNVALRLARLGFDGIELHGAHGYLLTQLLSPWSNTRADEYGGPIENRTRLIRDIAAAIRHGVDRPFIVGLKMPADEGVSGGINPEEAASITRRLAETTHFDYFAYGQGNFSISLENHVPDMHFQAGHFIDLHRQMRAASGGIPVMALGRIGTFELAERVVAEGFGDLVGMGRAQVSDAAFANKAERGELAAIRPCVFNNFCWGEVHAGKPIVEFHNPHLATRGEAAWSPAPATTHKRLAVVGAGPAGLEAAWVAAARGHHVDVFHSGDVPGGKLRLEAALPGHEEMTKVIDHQLAQAHSSGVNFKAGQKVEDLGLLLESYDEVVVATGSEQRQPDCLNDSSVSTYSMHELARARAQGVLPHGECAVLFDHDHTAPTYAGASLLASTHRRVVLVTPRTQVASFVNYCSALGIHRRLHQADIEIITASTVASIERGAATIQNVFSGTERVVDNCDTFVFSTPRRVETQFPEVSGRIHRIGDAMSPRNLMIAIHEGHALGNQL